VCYYFFVFLYTDGHKHIILLVEDVTRENNIGKNTLYSKNHRKLNYNYRDVVLLKALRDKTLSRDKMPLCACLYMKTHHYAPSLRTPVTFYVFIPCRCQDESIHATRCTRILSANSCRLFRSLFRLLYL